MGRVPNPDTYAGKHLSGDVVKKGNHSVRTSTGYLAATEAAGIIQGKYVGVCTDYSDHHIPEQTGDGLLELTISPRSRIEGEPITGATRAKVGDPVYVTGNYDAQILTMTKSGVEVGYLLEFRSATDSDLWSFATDAEYSSLSYDATADVGVAADVYAITPIPAPNEYKTGQKFIVLAPNTDNAGASTLNVGGLGAKNILDGEGNNPLAGDIVTTLPMNVVYDGTSFILFNPATKTTWKDNEERTVVGLDAGAADAYTVATDPFYPLADRLHVRIYDPLNDNTGASTLDYNGGGALAIVDGEGNALRAGAIVQTLPMELQYDVTNTRWILQNDAIEVTRKAEKADVLTVADTGVAADAYVAVTDPVIALAAGLTLILTAPNLDNTGATGLTYNTVADAVVDGEGNALRAGSIVATMPAVLIFDGANWILQNDAIEVTRKDEEADVLTVADTGVAANAYVAVTDPVIALAAGLTLVLLAPNLDNDAASDITYNGVADNIFDGEGNELQPGDIVATMPAVLVFDGVNWVLQNPATQTTRKDNDPIMLFDVDAGAADAYVAVTDPAPVLAAGIFLLLIAPAADCTGGACTLTFNGVADAILVAGGGAPAATDIQTDCPALLYFDGTNWILTNPQA